MGDRNKTVFVGLSGGVDSSVSATRLLERGYTVIGVFIKTWHPDFLVCNWEAERLDAMRVAAHLNIPFYTCDAEEVYRKEVAEYMIAEYTLGRTPNPDILCNRYVKFGAFLTYARAHGGDFVATGHYAQVSFDGTLYHLHRGEDTNKDQSYFLWTLTQEQLAQTLFPIGDTTKPKVRKEAEVALLPTSQKNDSQGICFLGQVDIKEFLSEYVTPVVGDVLDETGKRIGSHDGALLYTIGQRHGFTLFTTEKETLPRYVCAKDLERNTITVAIEHATLGGATLILTQVHTILGSLPATCEAQFRYRQKPFTVHTTRISDDSVALTIDDEHVALPSVGQSCVFYTGTECLGGGIIDEVRDTIH